jgi:hypothetical protein
MPRTAVSRATTSASLGGQRQHPFRRDLTTERGDQPPVDGGRRRAGQLLVEDRPDQRLEMGLGRRADVRGPDLGDQPAHDRVPLGQDVGRGLPAADRTGLWPS